MVLKYDYIHDISVMTSVMTHSLCHDKIFNLYLKPERNDSDEKGANIFGDDAIYD